MTGWWSYRMYARQQIDIEKKEKQRIQDVRSMLYHFLIRWKHGCSEEIKLIDEILSKTDPNIYLKPKPNKNENIVELSIRTPGLDVDTIPSQILKLELSDVLNILINKDDSKVERQKMTTQLYSYANLAIGIFKEMEDKNSSYGHEWRKLTDTFDEKFINIELMAQEILKNNFEDGDPAKINKTIVKINKIQVEFEMHERTIKNKFMYLINPILALSGNLQDSISPHARILFPVVQDYTTTYIKIHNLTKEFNELLIFWKDSFAKINTAIDNILNIEFFNEERYEIEPWETSMPPFPGLPS